MTDKSVELTDVQLGSQRGGVQKTERSLYLEERAKYKVFCAGLSTTDLGIASGLLINFKRRGKVILRVAFKYKWNRIGNHPVKSNSIGLTIVS